MLVIQHYQLQILREVRGEAFLQSIKVLKPFRARATNQHLRGKVERHGTQRRVKVSLDVCVAAAAVGEKAHLGTK